MPRASSLFLILGLAGCMGPEIPTVVTGEWGGEHLGLVVSGDGADLEYDCALGRISGEVRPDGNGRFSVLGVYFPGHGGPDPVPDPQTGRPARYDGSVRGDKMTLMVTLTDTGDFVGMFSLIRGASPHVLKCL
jgi:hypothetical protein